MSDLRPVLVIGALYAGSERGLAADVLCARALGLAPLPIATQLVVASDGRVTDVTDVPTDTVIAQLEHTLAVSPVEGVKIGVLAGHKTADAVFDRLSALGVPVVLDLVASGPSGETVLSAQGIDAVAARLGAVSLLTMSRADAELATGGEIASLDDAQVAAQRAANRGAAQVVIRCGNLPYRFYDAADDPGHPSGDGSPPPFFFDLAYDGEDFALFEAPMLPGLDPAGASSAFALAALAGLVGGRSVEEALQLAKRFASESVRHALPVAGGSPRLNPSWEVLGRTAP